MTSHKIFTMAFATVYPLYVKKVERKGHTVAELDEVITWLTGYTKAELEEQIAQQKTFEDFFATAKLNPAAVNITGTICGVKVQEIEDPLMQKIRYMDKVVDEVANGKAIEKIKRSVD